MAGTCPRVLDGRQDMEAGNRMEQVVDTVRFLERLSDAAELVRLCCRDEEPSSGCQPKALYGMRRLEKEDHMKLSGKVALITGAGSGFGRATAILFAKEGAKIVVADLNPDTAQETVSIIAGQGGDAIAVKADVSVARDCEAMIKAAMDKYGKLNILHNNAGIPQVMTSLVDIEEKDWDRLMNVNLKSVFLCSKAAIPVMKQQGGAIINTSSVGAVRARPGAGAYAIAKAGVTHLTRLMAVEFAPFKIRVNSISPVISETPLGLDLLPDKLKQDMEGTRKMFLSTIPIGRMAVPEDIANAALFLAMDESSMITGIDLLVDGGRAI
jgi:3-oxoacyl-[acyl-carrier protein] reductase